MASSQEKVLAFHMSRLKDKRPDVQLNAITELESMGAAAEDAMPALRECYLTAADEAVKAAAQRAGLAIFKAVKEAQQ